VQGYLFSKPVDEDTYRESLESRRAAERLVARMRLVAESVG
jgi:hypothetical protein